MNIKIIVFGLLATVYLSRLILVLMAGKSPKFLLVSFFLMSIPLHYSIPVFTPVFSTQAGTFGTQAYIYLPLILLVVAWPFFTFNKDLYYGKSNLWMIFVIILIAFSLFNPLTVSNYFVGIFCIFFFSHILFFKFLLKGFNKVELIKGIFDGFMVLCVCQFFLAICWPVLGITSVTTIFHVVGERTATRTGGRPGALGFFVHPGNLALFTIIATAFFQACFLNNNNKRLSAALILLNICTIFLTYSRTSYIVFTLVLLFVYFINKTANKPLFTLKNIFNFVLPAAVISGWIVFLSPLSSLFLKNDSDVQLDNRMIHWNMALKIFPTSPLMGVGINSHLEYFSKNFSLFNSMIIDDEFFWQMPIHNVHLLILVETGLAGLLLWFIFAVSSISSAKKDVANNRNEILSLTHMGLIVAFFLYGITGWAPLSDSILPYLLFFSFFTIKYRNFKLPQLG
ncbi:MAG: O-antigen ligase family protein [Ferruginibacter sp.]